MEKLSIHLEDDQTVFAPREPVQGTVQWNLVSPPKRLELSLFWYTEGKGTRDVGVVDTVTVENPGALGSKDFQFVLSDGPCSFSGRLISLIWAVELSCPDIVETVRQEIVVSHIGKEIVLSQ